MWTHALGMHLQALPLLASVACLIILFIGIAGLSGMHLFATGIHFLCQHPETGELLDAKKARPDEWGCGGSRTCPSPYVCTEFSNVNYENIAGFDNIALASLSAFQVHCSLINVVSHVCIAILIFRYRPASSCCAV
jgi:hypothetical protein